MDRDYFVDDVLKDYRNQIVEPVSQDAEAPLFLMYTSGTTGKPKGCQHRTGGYLAYVAGTSKYYQDIHPEDVYWCMADIGWITGHSYIVYGPLALGATSVLYEGVPQFPDAARPWRIAERLDVNIFHTSPTAIRMLRKAGGDEPKKYNYHFKHMTTVGEPIEPEVWRWYYETVGKGEAVIVDTWWQTETGGFLCSTKPALDPMKPGSAGPPVLGIYPVIWDENGEEVKPGSGKAGNICIRNPWPGIMQTIWGSSDRFVNQYYKKYCKNPKSKDWRDWPYYAADGAVLPADGYYRILGRVDDVINVAGHRLGTKEVESACLSIPEIAEAAVVPVVDEIKGRNDDRQNRTSQASPHRSGHAENALGKDHAPRAGSYFQSHGYRRHHYTRQSGYRCANSRASAGPQHRPSSRRPGRHQALWRGKITNRLVFGALARDASSYEIYAPFDVWDGHVDGERRWCAEFSQIISSR
jgi:acetyl-CoA synthetase